MRCCSGWPLPNHRGGAPDACLEDIKPSTNVCSGGPLGNLPKPGGGSGGRGYKSDGWDLPADSLPSPPLGGSDSPSDKVRRPVVLRPKAERALHPGRRRASRRKLGCRFSRRWRGRRHGKRRRQRQGVRRRASGPRRRVVWRLACWTLTGPSSIRSHRYACPSPVLTLRDLNLPWKDEVGCKLRFLIKQKATCLGGVGGKVKRQERPRYEGQQGVYRRRGRAKRRARRLSSLLSQGRIEDR